MIIPYTQLIYTLKKLTHPMRLQQPQKTTTQTIHAYMVHPIDINDKEADTSKVRLQLVHSSKTTTQTTHAFRLYPNSIPMARKQTRRSVIPTTQFLKNRDFKPPRAFILYPNSIPMTTKKQK